MRIFYFLLLSVLFSCVTPKTHNSLVAEYDLKTEKLEKLEKKLIVLNSKIDNKEQRITTLQAHILKLQNDSLKNANILVLLKQQYDDLSNTYDLLVSKNSRYISEKAKEIKRLLEQLDQTRIELFAKEDQLNILSSSLTRKEEELKFAQQDLQDRSQRVMELEKLINKKDSVVSSLKQSISKALIGLEGEGLTVLQKNGKVYISLEEDLLFASGKYEINDEGILALNKLSDVLANQKDLQILVEGHTDSIPYSRGQLKDNWDLSVMRATSVVKILLQNKLLNSSQLTAAGRAEYVPIKSNSTKNGRSANRRIEMILSPKLDDLFDLLSE